MSKLRKCTLSLDDIGEPQRIYFGISAHQKDYRIAWAINNQTDLQLAKHEDLVVEDKKKSRDFSLFLCRNDEEELVYTLVSNISEKGILDKKNRIFDFFFVVSGEVWKNLEQELHSKLKRIRLIQAVYLLDEKQTKQLNHLHLE